LQLHVKGGGRFADYRISRQRALFEAASSIQGARTAPPKDALAQFLHDHKDDAQRQQQGQSSF
jgi:hypothetical protein